MDDDDPTVNTVTDTFVEEYPRVAGELTDDEGAVWPSVRVLTDDNNAALDDVAPKTLH